MAVLHMEFHSQSLARKAAFIAILPNDLNPEMIKNNPHYKREPKTLYLLHGYSGSCSDWLTGSRIEELAAKYNIAVIMPSEDNSFYLNAKGTGHAYETFTGKELVEYAERTFGLSTKKEDTFIAGLSMGGFGALHTGLAYPEKFGKIAALSSALIIYDVDHMKPGTKDNVADYDYYKGVFGDLEQVTKSRSNPEVLVDELISNKKQIPSIYMACGTEDFLINQNHMFRDFLQHKKVKLTYTESPGIHDWQFWNQYLEPSIRWMLNIAK